MPRVYEQKFDRAEMLRLRKQGWTYQEMADKFGVSRNAIYYAIRRLDPVKREKHNEYHRNLMRQHKAAGDYGLCVDCKTPIWGAIYGGGDGPRLRCVPCAAAVRTFTVRDTELLCTRCEEWKLDAEFPKGGGSKGRRERHAFCRPCQAKVRQEYRERHKVPCEQCGEPCLPPSEKGAKGRRDRSLCRPCYVSSPEFPLGARKRVAA